MVRNILRNPQVLSYLELANLREHFKKWPFDRTKLEHYSANYLGLEIGKFVKVNLQSFDFLSL